MSSAEKPYNPQACVIEGARIGIFVGSAYKYLTIEQALQLQAQLGEAIAKLQGEVARG